MTFLSFACALLCLACAAAFVFAERYGWRAGRFASKMAASSCFVAVAAASGTVETVYGRFLLAALVLCWFGDLFLLSRKATWFLFGTLAFLLGHAAFAAAFASGPLDLRALLISSVIMFSFVVGVLYRRGRLPGIFGFTVPIYAAAIALMSSLAIAHSAASGSILAAAGAIAFTASDVSVARDRFIGRSAANYAWGVPLYYLGQILLALSSAHPDARPF